MFEGYQHDPDHRIDLTNWILSFPVGGDGTTLQGSPGVYPEVGLAYIHRDGSWLLAMEPDRFHREVLRGAQPGDLWMLTEFTPTNFFRFLKDHPSYAGRVRGREFRGGSWYAVRLGDVAEA